MSVMTSVQVDTAATATDGAGASVVLLEAAEVDDAEAAPWDDSAVAVPVGDEPYASAAEENGAALADPDAPTTANTAAEEEEEEDDGDSALEEDEDEPSLLDVEPPAAEVFWFVSWSFTAGGGLMVGKGGVKSFRWSGGPLFFWAPQASLST